MNPGESVHGEELLVLARTHAVRRYFASPVPSPVLQPLLLQALQVTPVRRGEAVVFISDGVPHWAGLTTCVGVSAGAPGRLHRLVHRVLAAFGPVEVDDASASELQPLAHRSRAGVEVLLPAALVPGGRQRVETGPLALAVRGYVRVTGDQGGAGPASAR